MTEIRNPLFVSSLSKAMDVLDVFLMPPHVFGMIEVIQHTGMDKSAVQRILFTLEQKGWLHRNNQTKKYTLPLRFVEGAFAYLINDQLMAHIAPHVINLSRELRETVNVARNDGTDMIYISRLPAKSTSYIQTVIGRRLPALNMSSGRVILASRSTSEIEEACSTWPIGAFCETSTLDRALIKERILEAKALGFSITQGELLTNEIGIAAAVQDETGRAVAAIQISVSNLRWTTERVRAELVAPLVDAAKAVSIPSYVTAHY